MTKPAAILLALQWAEATEKANVHEDEGRPKRAAKSRAWADKFWQRLQAAGYPSPLPLLAEHRAVHQAQAP